MGHRLLSYTEVTTAMTCMARWDFQYGGRLAGSTLRRKELAPILSDGRAWGAAVAAWHQHGGELLASWYAHQALLESYDNDRRRMRSSGFEADLETFVESQTRLQQILDHYTTVAEPLPNLTQLEGEIVVAVPARHSKRGSTRYRFQCFLDGFTDDDGLEYPVEFKLRGALMPAPLILRGRQPRWYAWAWWRKSGRAPAGVIVDERLNEPPKDPRILKSGKPSHAKDQLCTPEAYADACHLTGELPKLETSEHLRARLWQQRVPISFRPGELEAAGRELTSAAKLVRDLDSGELEPIRNAGRANCNGCTFRDVCDEPGDSLYVETIFDRTEPKRLRAPREHKELTG